MPQLLVLLALDRCPHCGTDRPTLTALARECFSTVAYNGKNKRHWRVYTCSRCGGAVLATSHVESGVVHEIYPTSVTVDAAIPEPARDYLHQALDSLHAPAGCVMLCASAVDAMLKAKSYRDGSLYSRINKAAEDHLITQGMAQWAHDVRIGANEPRHADEQAPLPSTEDARRCLDFALALGDFLFVLPSRVKRGLADAAQKDKAD